MIIKFKKEMTLEIVNEGDDSCDTESETFNAGEELDIDVWWWTNKAIQFADGSVSYVTPDFWQDVEVVKE